MSEQQQVDAILSLLNAALAPKVAYEVDTVPSPRPSEYVEVQIARRFGGQIRTCGAKATTGWRVTVYGISQYAVSDARLMLDKCRTALEYRRLQVGVATSTPAQFDAAGPISPDDGWFSGWHDYTFTIERNAS